MAFSITSRCDSTSPCTLPLLKSRESRKCSERLAITFAMAKGLKRYAIGWEAGGGEVSYLVAFLGCSSRRERISSLGRNGDGWWNEFAGAIPPNQSAGDDADRERQAHEAGEQTRGPSQDVSGVNVADPQAIDLEDEGRGPSVCRQECFAGRVIQQHTAASA